MDPKQRWLLAILGGIVAACVIAGSLFLILMITGDVRTSVVVWAVIG